MELKELNVQAREVKVDDQLLAVYDPAAVRSGKKVAELLGGVTVVTVTNVDRKSLLVHLNTNVGKLVVSQNAEMLIAKMVKTDAEKHADDVEYAEHQLDKFVADMRASVASNPMDYLVEKMAGYENDVARGLAWYVEDVMKASHRRGLAAKFCNWLDRDNERALDPDDEVAAKAIGRRQVFLQFCRELDKELAQKARSMSRSTNPMSNFSDDCELAAIAQMLDNFSGGVGYLRHLVENVEATS